MDTLLQDLRYAVRTLRHSPGFTLAVVLTLALGLGATVAVFGVLDRAVLRPLPVNEPDRLVHVLRALPQPGNPEEVSLGGDLPYPAFVDLRDRTTVFAGVAAQTNVQLALDVAGETRRLEAAAVSAGYFATLGVHLALGREILPEEDRPGAAQPVVVLSHALWMRQFGGDRAVLGRSVALNGRPYVTIGVAPLRFAGLARGWVTDAWIPVTASTSAGERAFERRTVSWLDVFARLAPGISREQAVAALAVLTRRLEGPGSYAPGEHFVLEDGGRGLTNLVGELANPLAVLMGAVLLVLAVACANVAGLLLARATARRREMAIRLSVGAGRRRLVGQLLIESLVLAVLGGGSGVLLAIWIAGVMPVIPTLFGAPLVIEPGLDGRILLFAAGVTTLAALCFGVLPAVRASRPDVVAGLKAGAAAAEATPGRPRLGGGPRDLLVVGQVAITLVLLAGAGLLVRTARNLRGVDPGYDPRNVLLVGLDLDPRGYRGREIVGFWDQLLQRVHGLPGVQATSLALTLVPNPGGTRWTGVPLEGFADTDSVDFDVNLVGPQYFEVMRIPVLRGRGFEARDRHGAPPVAVINEAMARRYWPGRNPLDLRIGDGASASTVVGVVRDGKYRSLREAARPMVYFSALQSPVTTGTLLVRAATPPSALVASIRREVRALDAGVPVFGVRTLEEHLALASARERLVAAVSVLFGCLALVLAAVGIAGLLAFVVARRTQEIGVRVALGATRSSVLRLVVGRGIRLAAAGLAVGAVGALLGGRVLASILYGVSATDIPVLGGAALVVMGIAAGASYLPAWRAAKVDPMVALRTE